MAVFHISRGTSRPLKEVFGGDEATHMTPAIAANIEVLNDTVSSWFDPESVEREVPLFNKSLDILATADIPDFGEAVNVAIENQYGVADADHFGRLVGWYMPEAAAEMGVLIAEGFDPHLIRAIDEGRIVQPRHGFWLVEATGQLVDGVPVVSYTLRATSLDRDQLLKREKAFRKNQFHSGNAKIQADLAETEALFAHIAASGDGPLTKRVRAAHTVSRWYRRVEENDYGCHLALFVGRNRISVGSAYLKGTLEEAVLERLTEVNRFTELDPPPSKRELRSLWWHLADLGRGTPRDAWPEDLGAILDERFDAVLPTLHEHQRRLLEVIQGK